MLEINDVRMLVPATVSFTQNNKKLSVFVYVDTVGKDLIIPDSSDIEDVSDFKAKFSGKYPFYKKNVIPDVPQNLERQRPK